MFSMWCWLIIVQIICSHLHFVFNHHLETVYTLLCGWILLPAREITAHVVQVKRKILFFTLLLVADGSWSVYWAFLFFRRTVRSSRITTSVKESEVGVYLKTVSRLMMDSTTWYASYVKVLMQLYGSTTILTSNLYQVRI